MMFAEHPDFLATDLVEVSDLSHPSSYLNVGGVYFPNHAIGVLIVWQTFPLHCLQPGLCQWNSNDDVQLSIVDHHL